MPTSHLGRIRLAAQAVGGSSDDLECLSSLLCLAITADLGSLLQEPTTGAGDARGHTEMEADAFVTAAYLGRKDYVAHLIAKGSARCGYHHAGRPESEVFGSALNAAAFKGHIEIIELLLSRIPEQYRLHKIIGILGTTTPPLWR
ncbi:hypothetical protein F5Y10DRAFT_269068 [Nemania abortiva]|nr:hypothetical protein F5Y10DRAFT_269068 [Nemania abortiva]